MRTTKSPIALLLAAHELGRRTVRRYWHHRAPKKFTLPQLFACLVLKEFLRLDYRKLSAVLEESPSWTAAIGLASVPHFTTFQKAAARLLENRRVQRMLDQTTRMGQELTLLPGRSPLAALDATGLESSTASRHYTQARSRAQKRGKQHTYLTYREFPKIGVLSDCTSHLVLAVVHDKGPSCDVRHFREAFDQARRRIPIQTLLADGGYDSEANHRHCREACGVRSLIPARLGRSGKPPRTYWRRVMASRLHTTRYGQRAQAETTISMLKRLLGPQLRARKKPMQRREAALKTLTLNLMIL
ncbi:transposase [Posidoniimonas corsicana]|uniref:transposase n=1 Tax=Posidoniimonas corsicana TaxID=1938618 RepID=UPI0018D350A1|nr:transposase [Posidoniimonas corsicana]